MSNVSKPPDSRSKQNQHRLSFSYRHKLCTSCFLLLAALVTVNNIYTSTKLSHSQPSSLSENHHHQGQNSRGDNDSRDDTNNLPVFVLHVGPGKTGTTTLQCALVTYDLKDSFHYIGKANQIMCPNDKIKRLYTNPYRIVQCLNHKLSETCQRCKKFCREWKTFLNFLEEQRTQSNNLIFSAEQFQDLKLEDDDVVKPLQSALSDWRVKIVVTYRRYHEHLISNFNQHYKNQSQFGNFISWPETGGQQVPTFRTFFDKLTKENFTRMEVGYNSIQRDLLMDPVGYLKRGYEKYFSDVSVLNFHDGDIVANFICQMLPGARNTCDSVKQHKTLKDRSENPSLSLHYDMLAIAAHSKQIVDRTLSRSAVRNAVHRRTENLKLSFHDFPMICLSSEEEELLLNMSLDIEKTLLPEFYASPKGEADHRASFASALQKKKFCSVDTDEVLKDDDWRDFFQSLGSK